jgi:hypothetical protein
MNYKDIQVPAGKEERSVPKNSRGDAPCYQRSGETPRGEGSDPQR